MMEYELNQVKQSWLLDQEKKDTVQCCNVALWSELQELQQQEMDLLHQKQDKLEQEKAAMSSFVPDMSDIVSINIGGKIVIQVHQGTLLVPTGSRFGTVQWLEDHCMMDSEGHVFLDQDPELVWVILHCLRNRRNRNSTEPFDPEVPQEKHKEWLSLLEHYGETSFFSCHCKFLTLPSSSLKDLRIDSMCQA
jgi:hypothetical protein